ncbi:MAG: outer membrane lipoprotein carrier protein LolA [Bacteroidales bacterium]|jgi:outer membrane lipoprotein carrier protein|nr:outer membrane lipoprotein carrier protein LolA [Bacteroidales bacterium]MBR0314102.1 outer membrane lipoprotein carrier protein LolA [Bacteroidales bacterium]MBR6972884.1 outer membrane lipoprotein carrier protein LolA [Bacteroidales bacterium]
MTGKRFFILALLTVACGWAFAQTPQEKEAFARIVSSTTGMKTMTADFVETKHLQMLEEDAVQSGRLWYKAPSSMRWEYGKDFYGVLSQRGAYMVRGGKRDGALTRGFSQTGKMVTGLISNLSDNLKEYKVTYVKEGKDLKVTAVPTSPRMKGMVDSVVMKFDTATCLIKSFEIRNSAGYTLITFSNVKKDVEIDSQLFN